MNASIQQSLTATRAAEKFEDPQMLVDQGQVQCNADDLRTLDPWAVMKTVLVADATDEAWQYVEQINTRQQGE